MPGTKPVTRPAVPANRIHCVRLTVSLTGCKLLLRSYKLNAADEAQRIVWVSS
jgi:hypothetical protein